MVVSVTESLHADDGVSVNDNKLFNSLPSRAMLESPDDDDDDPRELTMPNKPRVKESSTGLDLYVCEETEHRDDILDMCFSENPCNDIFGTQEPGADLLQEDDIMYIAPKASDGVSNSATGAIQEEKSQSVVPLLTTQAFDTKAATPGTGTNGQDEMAEQRDTTLDSNSLDIMLDFDNMCNPINFFEAKKAPIESEGQASSEPACETHDSGSNNADDDASDGSVSTMGQIFSDLASLPSLSTLGKNLLFIENGNQEESDNETISLGDLSSMSEGRKGGMDLQSGSEETNESSIKTAPSLDSAKIKEAIEQKLDELNLDKVPSDGAVVLRSSPSNTEEASVEISLIEEESAEYKYTRQGMLHEELRIAIETYGQHDIKCANITAALADVHFENGEYGQALKLYKAASSVYSAKLGDAHVTSIDSRIRVGKTLEKLGRHDDAIQTFHHVLEVCKGVNGAMDSSVADSLVLISKSLGRKEGRLLQALKELKRALKLYRTSLGDAHPKVATTVDGIASLYMQNGDYSKAASILDEVVKLKAAVYGMHNKDVAQTLIALGSARQASGDRAGALKSLKKAYSIYVSTLGEHSAGATSTLECIADHHRINGDNKQAIKVYTEVIKGKKWALGNLHPLLAPTFLDLGQCLRKSGDLEKAQKCLKQALSICVSEEDKNVQNADLIADVMQEMAIVHQRQGAPKSAIKVQKQELAIRRKMGASQLPKVARILSQLGAAHYDLRLYAQALSFLTEALDIYEKLDDDLGLDFAETLYTTGLVFQATKNRDRAHHAFMEALKIFHSHGLKDNHELVVMASSKLKELGHKCECKNETCQQVPCKSNYGTIHC